MNWELVSTNLLCASIVFVFGAVAIKAINLGCEKEHLQEDAYEAARRRGYAENELKDAKRENKKLRKRLDRIETTVNGDSEEGIAA